MGTAGADGIRRRVAARSAGHLCRRVHDSQRARPPRAQHQQHPGAEAGLPLSPTLFGLFIADLESRVLAATQRGEQLDLPDLAGQPMPPLLYADDMALLSTTAAGLQRQLRLLELYCAEQGLTVNLGKTKAYDTVPRHLLWARLEQAGLEGSCIRAVQALYANVPTCVRTSEGFTDTFQSLLGVK